MNSEFVNQLSGRLHAVDLRALLLQQLADPLLDELEVDVAGLDDRDAADAVVVLVLAWRATRRVAISPYLPRSRRRC